MPSQQGCVPFHIVADPSAMAQAVERLLTGDYLMRIQSTAAVVAALLLLSISAHANEGQGFGVCRTGFADSTLVKTESRGDVTIAQVQVDDRVWSFNGFIGKPGWAKVLKRVDGGQSYKILADFTEPGSSVVTKACWLIKRSS